jgi:serine protease AprX
MLLSFYFIARALAAPLLLRRLIWSEVRLSAKPTESRMDRERRSTKSRIAAATPSPPTQRNPTSARERKSVPPPSAAPTLPPTNSPERPERRSPNRIKAGPLPLVDRLKADPRFTGRGVVAAFLDAGFYAHPDLTQPYSRIHAYQDLLWFKDDVEALRTAEPSSWHGMMTTVVAAGNGALSGGRFRSLAPDLGIVAVKVGNMSRVLHHDIARGIEWVLTNRARYDIRILNISCGGDYEASHLDDVIARFAEAAVRAGIVVVAAAGNSGHNGPGNIVPPASVPAVITVGGIDDGGNPQAGRFTAYRSNYGPTIDGVAKPEVVTLADWLPAPILPDTPTHKQAQLLAKLGKTPDHELGAVLDKNRGVYPPLDEARPQPPYIIRQIVAGALRDGNVINEHYKMVDGTSFAAPIVSSVVAQMLEANPDLKPHEVKRILIETAQRVSNVEVDRQGWGAVQPAPAVAKALATRKR